MDVDRLPGNRSPVAMIPRCIPGYGSNPWRNIVSSGIVLARR